MVRSATAADIPAIVAMGRRFWAESPYASLLTVDSVCMQALATGLIEQPAGAVFVAEHDGAVVGMIGLVTHMHPLSGDQVAGEMFWFVEPSHRGSLGLRLLRAAETWAREQGAHVLNMVAPSEPVERLYQRLGYERIEVTYQRRLSA